MKRLSILLGLFLLLGGFTLWYLNSGKTEKSTVLGWDRQFKVEDASQIHKIFIAKRTGETTTLERRGDGWVYDGKYPVRPDAIENLLEAITTVRIKYLPPKAAYEHIISDLATRGIKVEIYDRNGRNLKTYYVGGTTPDERGTYMIMEGAEQPYVVELPLLEGQFRVRYELTGDAWRDRTIFAEKPEAIAEVAIEYPKQRNKSFRLRRNGKNFEVEPFYPSTPRLELPYQPGSGEAFLRGFRQIIGEGYENDYAKQDSVLQTVPFANIYLKTIDGHEKQVSVYPFPSLDAWGNLKSNVIERMYADVRRDTLRDFMLVQYRVFEKIFWGYDHFFKKPAG